MRYTQKIISQFKKVNSFKLPWILVILILFCTPNTIFASGLSEYTDRFGNGVLVGFDYSVDKLGSYLTTYKQGASKVNIVVSKTLEKTGNSASVIGDDINYAWNYIKSLFKSNTKEIVNKVEIKLNTPIKTQTQTSIRQGLTQTTTDSVSTPTVSKTNTDQPITKILTPATIIQRITEHPQTTIINQTDPNLLERIRGVELAILRNINFNSNQTDRVYESVGKNINETFDSITENGTLNNPTLNNATFANFTSIGNALFTKAPTLAHVFTPSWPLGTLNISDASLYINPESAVADSNLLGIAVNGAPKFVVDAEGDVYANNLILTGSTSSDSTNIGGNLTVQDSTILGDAGTDTLTVNSTATFVAAPIFTASAPFIVSSTTAVTNLNSDLLDGQHGSYYATAAGYIPYTGGTSNVDLGVHNLTVDTNSLFVDSVNHRVGVGTVTPGANLDIQKTGDVVLNLKSTDANGTYLTLDSSAATGNYNAIVGKRNGTESYRIGQYGASSDMIQFSVGTSFSEKMRIDSAGNVGIGTTSPQSIFHIGKSAPGNAGYKTYTGLADANEGLMFDYYYNTSNNNIRAFDFVALGAAVTGVGGSEMRFLTTPDVAAPVSPLVRMVINNHGNVGIGTTGPGSKLDVTTAGLAATQTTSSGLALVNTTAATALAPVQISPAIRWSGFGWKTDVTAASQAVDFRSFVVPVQGAANPTGYLSFGSSVNGAAYSDGQMVLTTAGNVGIGTTGPGAFLEVAGISAKALTGKFHASITDLTTMGTGVGGGITFTGYKTAQTAQEMFAGIDGYKENATPGDAAGAMRFFTQQSGTGLVERMRITSSGNVGIGTTGPGSKLDVTTAGLAATQTTSSGLALVNTTAATALAPVQISPAIRWSGFGWKTDVTAASQAVDFRSFVVPVQGAANPTGYLSFGSSVNGAAYSDGQMVLTTAGNVGIGTTAPGQKLTVVPSGNTTPSMDITYSFGVRNLSNTYTNLAFGNDASYAYIQSFENKPLQINNVGNNVIFNATAGNVGIGTTNPGYKLEVGSASVTGVVARFVNSSGYCDINPLTTSLTCTSDITLKKNITNLKDDKEFALQTVPTDMTSQSTFDKIMTLTPVKYNWNGEADTAVKHVGFIAQEVEQIFPDLVFTDPVTGLKSVAFTNLIPYTIEAIQEMNLKLGEIGDMTKPNIFRTAITSWLENSSNKITRIFTGEVCLTDADGQTECINRAELKSLKSLMNVGGTASAVVPNTSPAGSVPPAPTPPASTSPTGTTSVVTPVTSESSSTPTATSASGSSAPAVVAPVPEVAPTPSTTTTTDTSTAVSAPTAIPSPVGSGSPASTPTTTPTITP